jgi:hypothetical protein
MTCICHYINGLKIFVWSHFFQQSSFYGIITFLLDVLFMLIEKSCTVFLIDNPNASAVCKTFVVWWKDATANKSMVNSTVN